MFWSRELRGWSEKIKRCAGGLWTSRRGSVAIYAAMLSMVGLGAGVVAVDFGRLVVLRGQMQDRADAGALAAARQLDKLAGAIDRASEVAQSAMTQRSAIPGSATELAVSSLTFYSSYTAGGSQIETVDDAEAAYVLVELRGQSVIMMFQPVLELVSQVAGRGTVELEAQAVAGVDPFVCRAPPLMMCDFSEADAAADVMASAAVGKQIKLVAKGGGNFAPGNFGFLSTPEGSNAAGVIEDAMASEDEDQCYGQTVDTAPGGMVGPAGNGVNVRFDELSNPKPETTTPAANIISYPNDSDIEDAGVLIGNGSWDPEGYWDGRDHDAAWNATDLFAAVGAAATRYQVYLYELGESFAVNGPLTVYPIGGALAAGYTTITPAAADIPSDAVNPDDNDLDDVPADNLPASGEANRRVMTVTVLQCVALELNGNESDVPTDGLYVNVFLTEEVANPASPELYGEIIGPLTFSNSDNYFGNVRLFD